MKTRNIVIAFSMMLILASCKSEYEALLNSSDVDAKYAEAFRLFNNGKYSKAATMFESLTMVTDNTSKEDTVKYYWGLSNYRSKDFFTAEANFRQFSIDCPTSPFAADARFYRIDCLFRATYRYELDPKPTQTAIEEINRYLIEYPNNDKREACDLMLADLNERLDRKAYEGARLYYRMEDYKASRVAFRNILKDDADNIYREDILYYIAMSSYNYARLSYESKQKERYLTFIDDYYNFIGEIPESPYRKELDTMYKRAQKALGNYSGSDVDLQTKASDFEKERKRLQKEK